MTRKPPLGSQVFQKEFFPATTMPDKSWWSVLWPNPLAVLTHNKTSLL
jgi:hypothetical protein